MTNNQQHNIADTSTYLENDNETTTGTYLSSDLT